jgi:glycosyltransferase involved in cell wall biosynthesis
MIKGLETSALASKWNLCIICSHNNGSLITRLAMALRAYVTCFWRLLRHEVLLLHIHTAERGSFFRKSIFVWMANLFGVPVIMHMHAAEFREFFENCPGWIRSYIRWTLNRCDRIITLSSSWREFYGRLTHTRVEVIPNFTQTRQDKDLVTTTDKTTKVGVLYLGKFGARKGIYDLLQSVKAIYDQFPELELFCGGDGEVEIVRKKVEEEGMSKRVHILGWVGPQERSELLNRCQIYILPSYAEGLPVAIIEAMEANLAIIATNVGGIPEMILDGKNGLLITPGDIDGMTAALTSLITNPQLRSELGDSARETYLSTYSEEKAIPQIEAIYRDLLPSR